MIRTGLVSVTFRGLKPVEIIGLVVKAGLQGIEWGGDIHVPHGNLKRAREVYKMTEGQGVCVASYGSYYRAGCTGGDTGDFERVLETAVELHAPNIRIWAGNRGSGEADAGWWDRVVTDSMGAASLAQKEGIRLSFEYHGGTLTDTPASAVKLMTALNHPNAFIYWQPDYSRDEKARLEALNEVTAWLSNIHVFYWKNGDRLALEDGKAEWEKIFETISASNREHYCMLEFVRNDDPGQFLRDAEILKSLLVIYLNTV